MADEIAVRPAVEGDTGRILELLKASLGEGSIPREAAYWNWKHRANPFGVSPALLAEQGGQLVGLRAFMRWSWRSNGAEMRAVRAVDTATHPDFQGRGIFTRLTLALVDAMKEEGIDFIFNTPNRFSRPGYLKMGWSSVGRASLLIRPRRPFRVLRALVLSRGNGGGSDPAGHAEPRGDEFDVDRHLARPELDRLLRSQPRDSRLTTRRSREYLQWRYAHVPGFEYHAAGSWAEGEEALILFRVRRRSGLTELRLCDVLVAPGASRQASALARNAIRAVRPDYAVAMAAWNTPEHRALTLACFLPAPRTGPILTIRALSKSASSAGLNQWSDWRASVGDMELF
jgi:GNAT superfamily N-acetyltransferase